MIFNLLSWKPWFLFIIIIIIKAVTITTTTTSKTNIYNNSTISMNIIKYPIEPIFLWLKFEPEKFNNNKKQRLSTSLMSRIV